MNSSAITPPESNFGHLFLSGMSGTGKSTVGPILARSIGLGYLDLDAHYHRIHKQSPASAIRQNGESSFRRQEAQLLAGLPAKPHVIACGGGTLTRPETLETAQRLGVVITLQAAPEILAQRLQDASRHPLLEGKSLLDALRTMEVTRWAWYRKADVIVRTDDRSPYEVSYRIVADLERAGKLLPAQVFAPRFSTVDGGLEGTVWLGERSYPVHLSGELQPGGMAAYFNEVLGTPIAVLVADRKVVMEYADSLMTAFGGGLPVVQLESGEKAKAVGGIEKLAGQLLRRNVDRTTPVAVIGGGCALDAGGFLAAVYMRGIPCVYIPTTLLAAVDAAIGGKTAMNTGDVKNLVGVIRQPLAVYVPMPWIRDEIAVRGGHDGAAEMLKTALLAGTEEATIRQWAKVLRRIRAGGYKGTERGLLMTELSKMITTVAGYKMGIIARDEYEQGERTLLNLGHTGAHLIEAATWYSLSHGRAVGWGLVSAARMAVKQGLASPDLVTYVESLARDFELWPLPSVKLPPDLVQRLGSDKKRQGEVVNLVLLCEPGKAKVVPFALEEAKNLLASCL